MDVSRALGEGLRGLGVYCLVSVDGHEARARTLGEADASTGGG